MERTAVRSLVGLSLCLLLAGEAIAQSPGEVTVADVIPTGNRLIPTEQILSQIGTRKDGPFSQQMLQSDQQALLRLGAFSDVRVRTQTSSDGRMIVYFDVAELPNLIREIRYDGAKHMKDEDLAKITELKRGTPLNPHRNQRAAQLIAAKYRDEGRLWASVNLKEGGAAGDTRVVFDITEGPEVKVRDTKFNGHGQWVSDARLRNQLLTSRSFLGIGGKFIPKMVEEDVRILTDYFRTLGYLDARVSPEYQWSADRSGVTIIFHIHEGKQYRVGKVQFQGNKVYNEEKLKQLVKLREGMTYDKNVIQADAQVITDKYGFDGHRILVRAQEYSTPEEGVVTVQYEIVEGKPVRVGNVQIIGNTRTEDRIVLRELGLYPGQILTWPDIRIAEQRLANLNIFEMNAETGVRPTVEVRDLDSPSEFKDIVVNVQETSTGTFMLGMAVNSDAGLSGQVVINERNFNIFRVPRSLDDLLSGNAFRGGGQEFRLEAMPGTQFQRYTVSFREPHLLDSPVSLMLNGYYYTRGFVEYNENRVGAQASVGRQLNRYWNAAGTFRVEGVNVFDVSPFAPPDIVNNGGRSLLLGFRGAVGRDSRDSYLRPTTGSVFQASFEQVLGTYIYPLGSVEFTKFWNTWSRRDGSGKHVLSARSAAYFAGDNTPVYERYYGGGFRSLRGFSFRGVGPFVNGLNVGGQFSLLNTLEYQVPVLANDKFFVVGFVDSGTVERKFNITDYRVTAGFGFRLVTPLTGPVPIAIDFGFPIVRGPSDRQQVFSFYVGFSN